MQEGESQNGDEVPEYAEILRRVADSPRNYPIPRKVSRKHLEQAFLTSFELIGGVPRLAVWADQNPDKFYALLSKLFPQQMEAKVGVSESLAAILTKMGSPRPTVHDMSNVSDAEIIPPAPVAQPQSIPGYSEKDTGSIPVGGATDTMVHTREGTPA